MRPGSFERAGGARFIGATNGRVIHGAGAAPGGSGYHCKPQLFLEPGIRPGVGITNVGILANGVIDEEP